MHNPTRDPKPVPAPAYSFAEYPLMMYKPGERRTHTVRNAEEEGRMTAQGWGRTPVDPPTPAVPQTDTEIALEGREHAHRAAMADLKEKYENSIGVLQTELALIRGQYAALEANNAALRPKLISDAGEPAKGKKN
jgi:hypothetical protein